MTRALSSMLFVLACAGLALAQDGIPIRNPGFEADADGDGLPDDWTFGWRSTHNNDSERGIEKLEPDWGWDTQIRHSGAASVRCGVSRDVDDGVWTQDAVALPEGARYLKVTAWCRARDVDDGAGTVAVVFLGDDGKWLGANYQGIAVTQDCDWTLYTGYAQIPKDSRTVRLRCWTNFAYTGTGTFWFDDLAAVVVDEMVEPVTLYLDDSPSRAPTADESVWGFFAFSRSYLHLLFPATSVGDDDTPLLRASACPGESEPVVLAIRPFRDDLEDVRVTVSDLEGPGVIPSAAIDVRSVRFHPRQGQARWGPFNETLMEVPLFLEKRDGLTVSKGATQPFWLTVHVPPDAAPGGYRGTVTVQAANRPDAQLPLSVSVHPFQLAEPRGLTFAMYARLREDPAWIAETFADMRAHGMTSIGLCGNSGLALSAGDGGISIDWTGESALERNMDAYTNAGFPEPMVWLMGADIPRFCEQHADIDTDEFAEMFRQIITAINAHGTEAGWPEIIYQPVDEPFEHSVSMARATRLLQVLKSIPGVRTEEDGMNGAWHNFTDEVYDLTDVLVLHDGPTLHRGRIDMDEWWEFHEKAMADGKAIWFYNIDLTGWHPEPMRFMAGFGLWKSKATGVIEWAYMWPVKPEDPGAVYQQPKALLYRFPAAPGESGGPTIAYEAFREGIDDYRYLLTLSQLVERAKATGTPLLARVAQDIWRPVQARLDAASFEGCKGSAAQGKWTGKCEVLPDGSRAVRGQHKIDNNWQFADCDALREQISVGITTLALALEDWSR